MPAATDTKSPRPPKHFMASRRGLILPRTEEQPACVCETCGAWLTRGEAGWVCSAGMHQRIVPDFLLCDRIRAAGHDRGHWFFRPEAAELLDWYTRRPDLAPRSPLYHARNKRRKKKARSAG